MTDQTLTPFGKLMKAAMDRRRISQRRLGGMLSDYFGSGPILDATSIRMIQRGERRLTHDLVGQIIKILAKDEEEADRMWHAAGLIEPGMSFAAYRAGAEVHRQRRRSDREVPRGSGGLRPASRASARSPVAFKRSCAPHARQAA